MEKYLNDIINNIIIVRQKDEPKMYTMNQFYLLPPFEGISF